MSALCRRQATIPACAGSALAGVVAVALSAWPTGAAAVAAELTVAALLLLLAWPTVLAAVAAELLVAALLLLLAWPIVPAVVVAAEMPVVADMTLVLGSPLH